MQSHKQDKVPVKPLSNKKYWMSRYIYLYWKHQWLVPLIVSVDIKTDHKLDNQLRCVYFETWNKNDLKHGFTNIYRRYRVQYCEGQINLFRSRTAHLVLLNVAFSSRPSPPPRKYLISTVKRSKICVWNCSVITCNLSDAKSVNWVHNSDPAGVFSI